MRGDLQDIREKYIKSSVRVVIKIGTRVLTEKDNTLAYSVLDSIVEQVSRCSKNRHQFIIVSSGAIALGLNRMGLDRRPAEINLLQAAASMGQSGLMRAYELAFEKNKFKIAQILLTYEDIQNRRRYLNVRNTIFTIWNFRAIPIVNENDAVSFAEIRFGDNDLLAAYLANMIDADLLIILTDIEGVYDKNPNLYSDAVIIPTISRVNGEINRVAEGKGSRFSAGGMESKLKAAEIATRGGIGVVIASGKKLDLKAILEGERIGTFCTPSGKRLKGKKKWIAFNPSVAGKIVIDAGGVSALVRGHKSLLPAGVKLVVGNFEIGDNVSIVDECDKEIARGLTNFSSKEIDRIKGLNTNKIPELLGVDTYFEEVVHRDNLVILTG